MKSPNFSFLFLFLFLLSTTIQAQVAVSASNEIVASNQTSISLAYSVPAGNDRLLLVSAGSDLAPQSVLFGATPMILQNSLPLTGDASTWTLALGNSGTTTSGSIVFTIVGATAAAYVAINAISFTGVDQSTPVENIVEQSIAMDATSSSITITSKANDLVYDGIIIACVTSPFPFCVTAPTATPLVGTTVQNELVFSGSSAGIGFTGRGITGTSAGASSVTSEWVFSGNVGIGGVHNGLNIRSSTALPVELSSFTVQQKKQDLVLEWVTQSEINNLGFDIERSTDGVYFDKIAFVSSRGDSKSIRSYEFTDKAPLQGQIYFRLKQWDQDGTFDYSEVVTINKDRLEFSIYPNPASGAINIEVNATPSAELSLYDSKGSLLKQVELQSRKNTLDISDLPEGVFMLVLKQGNQLFFERLITLD